jgi:hypothetical protein
MPHIRLTAPVLGTPDPRGLARVPPVWPPEAGSEALLFVRT